MDQAEKTRAEDLRLRCLKIVHSAEGDYTLDQVLNTARALYDFVTDAPKRPQLFAIKRADVASDDPDSAQYLLIGGSFVRWGYEGFAFRFRSSAEALDAIVKYQAEVGGVMKVEALPDYLEPF